MAKTTIYELMGFLIAFLGIGVAYYAIYFQSRLIGPRKLRKPSWSLHLRLRGS